MLPGASTTNEGVANLEVPAAGVPGLAPRMPSVRIVGFPASVK